MSYIRSLIQDDSFSLVQFSCTFYSLYKNKEMKTLWEEEAKKGLWKYLLCKNNSRGLQRKKEKEKDDTEIQNIKDRSKKNKQFT